MNHSQLQEIVEELSGELDRKHGVGIGWSGPITAAYLRGYGSAHSQAQYDAAADLDAHKNHGWYT